MGPLYMEIAINSACSFSASRILRNIGYEQLSYVAYVPSKLGDSKATVYSRSA